MSQAYEDLAGGVGRAVYFRAQRFRARVAMKHSIPEVTLGNVAVSLYDYSTTGMAVRAQEIPGHLRVGAVLPVSLVLNGIPVFSGQGEIVRAKAGTLGVRLVDTILDTAALQATQDRIVVRDAVTHGTSRFANVGLDYRRLCGDAAFFFAYWRSALGRLRANPTTEAGSAARCEIEEAAEQQMRREWRDIRARGNDLTRMLSPDDPTFAAVKRFTEIQVTPLTLSAPIWKRAYEKPLGYPGDFILMTYMYDAVRRGASPFSRILHQLGREERLAATVPSRKDLLIDVIGDVVRARDSSKGDSVRLLSIGAGPAREIEDYIALGRDRTPLVVSLVDQDEDALTYACDRVRKAALHARRKVEIRARYIAFGQLLSRRDLLTELSGEDLIYSAGLVDYLRDGIARGLLDLCYSLVAPGGMLFFGNALNAPDVRWVPEFLLDWRMIYRSEKELQSLASHLPPDAQVSVRTDSSNAWCFLVVAKPLRIGES